MNAKRQPLDKARAAAHYTAMLYVNMAAQAEADRIADIKARAQAFILANPKPRAVFEV